MPTIASEKAEIEGVLSVARAMAVAARTAPKARGVDAIETLIVYGEDLDELAGAMEKHGSKFASLEGSFGRDAENVRASNAVLLIGLRDLRPKKPENPLDCGACGHGDCAGFLRIKKTEGKSYPGPVCLTVNLFSWCNGSDLESYGRYGGICSWINAMVRCRELLDGLKGGSSTATLLTGAC